MSSITDETGGVTQDQTVLRRVAMMQQDRLRAVDLSQAMKATARQAAQVVGEHELVEVRVRVSEGSGLAVLMLLGTLLTKWALPAAVRCVQ